MTRKMATAASRAKGPSGKTLVKVNAYKRCFEGEHGEMVLADLANIVGMFRPIGYQNFQGGKHEGADFALNAALGAARSQVVRHILNMLEFSDGQMIALEKAAREEAGR